MSQKQRAKRKLTSKDKWKLWLNSWRPSEMKKTWKEEYARVHGNANYLIEKGTDKLMGKK